jgi:hypothetical protein
MFSRWMGNGSLRFRISSKQVDPLRFWFDGSCQRWPLQIKMKWLLDSYAWIRLNFGKVGLNFGWNWLIWQNHPLESNKFYRILDMSSHWSGLDCDYLLKVGVFQNSALIACYGRKLCRICVIHNSIDLVSHLSREYSARFRIKFSCFGKLVSRDWELFWTWIFKKMLLSMYHILVFFVNRMGLYCTKQYSTSPYYTKTPEENRKLHTRTSRSPCTLLHRPPQPLTVPPTEDDQMRRSPSRTTSTSHHRSVAPNLGKCRNSKRRWTTLPTY